MAGEFEPRALRRELTLRLGTEALRRAKGACGSKTLRESMVLVRTDDTFLRVFVPHYWALFYHEGSKAIEGVNMVWFKDKTADPRTAFGTRYPIRVDEIQHLTKEEFKKARREGKIIVTKRRKARPGRPFFDEGLADFATAADPIAKSLLDEVLAKVLPRESATISMPI